MDLSKNAMVFRYLLGVTPSLTPTQLLKFAYLADCEARKHLGRPISDFKYIRHNHGPFDKGLYATIDELKDHGLATVKDVSFPGGNSGSLIKPTDQPVEFDFDRTETEVLSFIAKTYMGMKVNSLCEDIVYETEPMKADVGRGEELPMSILDNKEKSKFGFDLERLLQSEQSIREGRYRPMIEAIDELFPAGNPGS